MNLIKVHEKFFIRHNIVLDTLNVLGWIINAQFFEKLEVHESQQSNVKFYECPNHFIIDIEWQAMVELIRAHPCHVLAHELNL